MKTKRFAALAAAWLALSCVNAQNAATGGNSTASAGPREFIVSMGAGDLASFDQAAAQAKALGATHMVITDDILPETWQFNNSGDPYPAWFIYHASLLDVFAPDALKPFINAEYAEKMRQLYTERCKILRKYGLKAAWQTNEPAVLPEAFFTAYPELRGPRVDQPNRSRQTWFAPCTDRPETLALYREALKKMWASCPEVEIFNLVTTDAGSGFCWVPGLYPGANGPAWCRDRSMGERVSEFLLNYQVAAKEAGKTVEVNVRQIEPRDWMIPSFGQPMEIVRLLPRGFAVNNLEGPDGRSFVSRSGSARGPLYPVMGIPFPDTRASAGGNATRRLVNFGDETVRDFNVALYQATNSLPARTQLERLTALRTFAVAQAGEARADDLMSLWIALNDVTRDLDAVDFGPLFRMGHVLTRWINRPLVPFPGELSRAERSYYGDFLLQAKGREQADDLVNVQAMDMYEGWGARLLFQRVIEITTPRLREAIRCAARLRDSAPDAAKREQWDLLDKRLEVALCLLKTADNIVKYQAQLERIKSLGLKPDPNPVLGTQNSWDRTDLMQIARDEIDNTVACRALLLSTKAPLIDMVPTPAEQSIMRLGPNLADDLKHKIDIMNAHWRDYDRLFTMPNP